MLLVDVDWNHDEDVRNLMMMYVKNLERNLMMMEEELMKEELSRR
jgi:hypothetical protein